jgi:anti-anti-sigma factor
VLVTPEDEAAATVIIRLPARVDDDFVARLGAVLRRRAREAAAAEVHLDGSSVEYVSTRGLALLLGVQRLTRGGTRRVSIVRPSPHLERCIHMGGLTHRLRILKLRP